MAIKKRNPLFVIGLSLITVGLYTIYWFYQTRQELNELGSEERSPLMHTIGLLVPFVGFYVLWLYSSDVEAVTKKAKDKVILFLAWIVFFPVALYMVQEELNARATTQ